MTTFAQWKKHVEPELFAGMRARGFEPHKWCTFARTSARGISLILAFDIESKVRLRVYPNLWVPKLDADKPNLVFPDDATQYARFITYKVLEWPRSWAIDTEAAAKQSIRPARQVRPVYAPVGMRHRQWK